MGFRQLELHRAYDSGSSDCDVLHDFYVPVLQQSVQYDRLAGYFSSGALAVAARGVAGLICNGGSMRIVASPYFTKSDLQVLQSEASDEEVDALVAAVSERALDLDSLANQVARDHVRALAWMLAADRLEMRLVVPQRRSKLGEGLFHQKVGVLRDAEGDIVSFSGSINETAAGWSENIEEFKVFRSWESSESEFLNHDLELFSRYWSCSSGALRCIPLPEAVRRKLVEYAPVDLEQLDLDALHMSSSARSRPRVQLRDYQTSAIDEWFKNDCRGILEMATGTGKTKTAIAALERLEQAGGSQLCVVTAPYQHIAVQWAADLESHKCVCLFEERDWRRALGNLRSSVRLGQVTNVYVCAVQNTAMLPDFRRLLANLAHDFDRCVFVGDEVHGLGAPETRQALADFYTHRLGLSATPTRWFDDEGTSVLLEFFGKIVYTFGIREALDWRDPDTGLSALCPYKYWPVFVNLDGAELEQYQDLTERLVKHLGHDDDSDQQAQLERLLFLRAGIVKEASQKIGAVARILDGADAFSHALIYCHSTSQMGEVNKVLLSRGIKYHRFTGEEETKPDLAYGGLSEREHIIRSLDNGEIDALVAMKCLDEGVDVPSAQLGIILASSSNPREFIQRRGRLLRRSESKEHAEIFDVVVAPNIDWQSDPRVRVIERRVFAKELERIDDFAATALNGLEARAEVLKLLDRLT